jgi:hypothetical protein
LSYQLQVLPNTGLLNSPEDQQKSECTTVKVTADKSNYWTPILYWINKNNTYTAMTGGTRIYYMLHNKTGPITAFPEGMRIISGTAAKRDPGAEAAQGVRLTLEAYIANATGNAQYLPNSTTHPDPPGQDYVQMNIYFPNCGWANQSLDSPDHFSHMTWEVNGGGKWQVNSRTCPASHPIMYPQIFIETFWHLDERMRKEWRRDVPNFILSNGDVTGMTFHGDFVAGWDEQVLQDAIDHCHTAGDNLEGCPAFANLMQYKPGMELQNCRIQSQIPDEDVGMYRAIEHLPGCNPRWDWDGPLTKPTDCPWYNKTNTPGWVSPNIQYMGPDNIQIPLALPGVDTSDVKKLQPMSGFRWNRKESKVTFTPKILPWAVDRTGTKNITNVMKGTQADTNSNKVAVSGVNTVAKGYGMGCWETTSWTGIAPENPISAERLAKVKNATLPNAKKSRNCWTNQPWYGFQCSEDVAPGSTTAHRKRRLNSFH